MRAIRQRVRVLPGGRIEITDPALQPGTEAEVVVLLPGPTGDGATAPPEVATSERRMLTFEELEALPPLPLDRILGAAPSGRTAEEVDRDLRALRDEWDRGELD